MGILPSQLLISSSSKWDCVRKVNTLASDNALCSVKDKYRNNAFNIQGSKSRRGYFATLSSGAIAQEGY